MPRMEVGIVYVCCTKGKQCSDDINSMLSFVFDGNVKFNISSLDFYLYLSYPGNQCPPLIPEHSSKIYKRISCK